MKKVFFSIFICFSCVGYSQNKLDLFAVARKGNLAQINAIFEANPKAIFSVNENGFSPLILACYYNNYDITKFLLEHDSDVNISSSMGTPLMAAVYKGNFKITQLLLENKAEVNYADTNGTTALIYAAMFRNSDLVQLLLLNNANKTKIDNKGKTAFEYAVFSGDEKTINLLK
jgi:uncharacterized protein